MGVAVVGGGVGGGGIRENNFLLKVLKPLNEIQEILNFCKIFQMFHLEILHNTQVPRPKCFTLKNSPLLPQKT